MEPYLKAKRKKDNQALVLEPGRKWARPFSHQSLKQSKSSTSNYVKIEKFRQNAHGQKITQIVGIALNFRV